MKLIINADDFGMSKSVNDAVKELCKYNAISSTSVMANMPFVNEIEDILQFNKISIGLHINLTQGQPVSSPEEIPSIVDKNGNFFTKAKLQKLINARQVVYSHIQTEVFAQFYKLKSLVGDRLDHFDSHQGSTRINMVYNALLELIKKENISFGIRVHCKYYLNSTKQNAMVLIPGIFSLKHFGMKRVIIEYIFRMKRNSWRKNFKSPDGMLLSKNHNTVRLLLEIANIKNSPDSSKILELSCHPATNFNDLTETKMMKERIDEYNILKSKDFLQGLNHLKLINFSDI